MSVTIPGPPRGPFSNAVPHTPAQFDNVLYVLGEIVGDRDGLEEGDKDGLDKGVCDGVEVGNNDGLDEGDRDGAEVDDSERVEGGN